MLILIVSCGICKIILNLYVTIWSLFWEGIHLYFLCVLLQSMSLVALVCVLLWMYVFGFVAGILEIVVCGGLGGLFVWWC